MTKETIVNESRQTPLENGHHTDETTSIWASILRDVKSSTKKAPTSKCLVVLGDNESGRTTLVAKLQGNDDPKRGAGLEYHYIDVKDDDRDDTPKLGVWILDGDAACSAPLLKYAIKPETLENTVLILVASMTQPWALLSTLKKWTTLIEEHLDRLHIDPTHLQHMRDRLQYRFQHYVEPNDSSTTLKNGIGTNRVSSSVSLASTTPLNGDEQIDSLLPDGVLSKSLGIPVIVVITKCDVMATLEKDNDYKDEYFDFMQYHLRKFCLEYGAALFYTSVKEKKNIDKLYKYIIHQCCDYPFTSPAAIIDRDAIFIPTGWDNPRKTDILLENLHRLKSTDNYSDVFVKPFLRRPLQNENEIIMAEDDQEFLAKLQLTLNRTVSPGRADESSTSRLPHASEGSSMTPSERRSTKPSNVTSGDQNRGGSEGPLANFFNSLLTRKSAGPGTPTTAAAPLTQRTTSKSPTTPTARRLSQHPMTFAVTPPPGRSRTPTSHKTFLASLNADSSPKSLSPVTEQQPKEPLTASSPVLPTIVRTPVDDGEAVKIFNGAPDQPSTDTNVESERLDQHEEPADPISSNIEQSPPNDLPLLQSVASEQEKETVQSPSLHAPVTDFGENDHSEQVTSTPLDAVTSAEDQKISFPTSPSKSLDLSPSVDHTTTRVLSTEELDQNNDVEKNNPEDSFNFNHRNSVTNAPVSSRPFESELQQIEDQILPASEKDESTSLNTETANIDVVSDDRLLSDQVDIQQSQVPNVTTSEEEQADQANKSLATPNTNLNDSFSPREMSEETELSQSPATQIYDDVQSTTIDPLLASSTNVQQIDPFIVQDDLHQSPTNDTTISSNVLLNAESTTTIQTSAVDPDDAQSESPLTQNEIARSDSPLSNLHQEQQRSRSPSPTTEPQHLQNQTSSLNDQPTQNRSRSPSPITEPQHLQNQTSSLDDQPTQNRSRSPSPTMEQKDRSPSLPYQPERERSRSPSPTVGQNDRPLSPIQQEQRSRSPSPTVGQNGRPPSPIQQEQRSRSPSPTVGQNDRPPSPIQHEQRSRSPSPTARQNDRPPSSVLEEKQQNDQSQTPHQQDQQRSRSPSPTVRQNDRSPSPIQHEQRNRSPSPTVEKKQKNDQSQTPHQQDQQRSRSPSPVVEGKQQSDQSPSPLHQMENQRSRSTSPIQQQEQQQRSRSASPVHQQEQRSRSPSPVVEEKQQNDQSPSSNHQLKNQSSRSASPVTEQQNQPDQSTSSVIPSDEERSRSPSPIQQQEQQQRSHSTSPIHQQEQRNRSPSPIHQLENQRDRSSPSVVEGTQQSDQSSSPTHQLEDQRSRSPSPIIEQPDRTDQSASSIIQLEKERSRSPSPVSSQEQKQTELSSPIEAHTQLGSQSPISTVQEEHRRSRSPSPTANRGAQNRQTSPADDASQQVRRLSSFNVDQVSQNEHPTFQTIDQIQDKRRSPSPTTEKSDQRSRSPSPINEIGQTDSRERSESPSLQMEQKSERSPSPSHQARKGSTHTDDDSLRRVSVDHNTKILSTDELESFSNLNNNEEVQPNTPASPKSEKDKSSQLLSNLNDVSLPSPIQEQIGMDYGHASPHTIDENVATPLTPSSVNTQNEPRASSPTLQADSSKDHHDESHAKASTARQSNITRSKSQSAVARPNTLPFSPNNHDLDGLYTSNDYDDEDELATDNEHHHHSAPSTVTVEYRRSSLLDNSNIQEGPVTPDPTEISKRLSIVEKARNEDGEPTDADPTNSKNT